MRRLLLASILFFSCISLSSTVPAQRASLNLNLEQLIASSRKDETKSVLCTGCRYILRGLRLLIEQEAADEVLEDFAVTACKTFGLALDHVCDTLPHTFGQEVFYVLGHSTELDPDEICAGLLSDCGEFDNPLQENWTIPIPGNKPPVKPWPVPTQPKSTMRVLHLSDIHIDRQYAVGSEADCSKKGDISMLELCCRFNPTMKESKPIKNPAGKWGTVANCDIPYETFENAIQHISSNHKDLDYILITGDFEAHDPWEYTREKTIASIANVTNTVHKYFPNIPIYQAIGNHEGVPTDAFPPHTLPVYEQQGPAWLYEIFAKTWGPWLPSTTTPTIQYRGSYTFRPFSGVKFISLNTIYCAQYNFYLYINQTDPDDTLVWLIGELLDSEKIGEKVHIYSHIPGGDSYCLKGWAHNYYEIVNRFENTIAAQFFGHTHNDHFQMYYENSDPNGRPTHFNWIAPSLTTQSFAQPSYRIYTIDGNYPGSSWTVLDAETYSTNLTDANLKGTAPVWTLEYNTRQVYGMPDLSPASWNDLIKRFQTDDALFTKFVQFFNRDNKGLPCDAQCKKSYLCSLRSAKSYESGIFCKGL